MSNILKCPAKYVQGPGALHEIDQHLVEGMGKRLFAIIDPAVFDVVKPILEKCAKDNELFVHCESFYGECSRNTVNRYMEVAKEKQSTVILGIGGGKTMDSAKAIAHLLHMQMVIVPTAASTDAPCSSTSVLYHDDGEFDDWLFLEANPNLVLVDTDIIIKAPVKLLVAGMGDAMSTFFEARVCRASGKNNQVKGTPTIAGTAMASKCWEILQRDGVRAKIAAEAGVITPAFESIVEVNTLLSSIGFESGGLGAAHAIQKGFTLIPELHKAYHGNIVAFCTIVQLVMENVEDAELNAVLKFCIDVGLPICFDDFGYQEIDKEMLWEVADKTNKVGRTVHNLPFEVTTKLIYEGLLAADAIGKDFHKKYS